jgi:hypothetical protein
LLLCWSYTQKDKKVVLVLPHVVTFLQFYEVAQVIERFLLLETIKFYTEYSTLEHKSW